MLSFRLHTPFASSSSTKHAKIATAVSVAKKRIPRATSTPILIERRQYTFKASQKRVCQILQLAAIDGINIMAFTISATTAKHKTRVLIVVGPPESNSPTQNGDLQTILKNYKIHYSYASVLQLLNVQPVSGTPGGIIRFYNALEAQKILLKACYYGEPAPDFVISVIFQPSRHNFQRAKLTLESA